MPEMPHAGDDHGHAVLVRGRNHILVAQAAAGLNRGGCAGLSHYVEPVAKGKNASEPTTLPWVSSPRSRARETAILAESTRLI